MTGCRHIGDVACSSVLPVSAFQCDPIFRLQGCLQPRDRYLPTIPDPPLGFPLFLCSKVRLGGV